MLPQNAESEAEDQDGKPKKRPKLDRHVDKWIMHPFPNSARTDGLQLKHWVKDKEQDENY